MGRASIRLKTSPTGWSPAPSVGTERSARALLAHGADGAHRLAEASPERPCEPSQRDTVKWPREDRCQLL